MLALTLESTRLVADRSRERGRFDGFCAFDTSGGDGTVSCGLSTSDKTGAAYVDEIPQKREVDLKNSRRSGAKLNMAVIRLNVVVTRGLDIAFLI